MSPVRLRPLSRWTRSAVSGTGVQAHRGEGELRQANQREADRRYTDVTFKIRQSGPGSKKFNLPELGSG